MLCNHQVFNCFMEARGGIEPPIKVLQTLALPLGYRAVGKLRDCNLSVPRPVRTDTFLRTVARSPEKTDLKARHYEDKHPPVCARLHGCPVPRKILDGQYKPSR